MNRKRVEMAHRARGAGELRDVAGEADTGWIWGNSRGGGGAPLKDSTGKPLANLKLVLAGDVEPDHSPSKMGGGMFDDDDDYGAAPRTSRRGGYDEYDDDDYRGGGGNRRGGGRGRGHDRDPYGEDDYDEPRDNSRRRGNANPPPRRTQQQQQQPRYDEEEESFGGLRNRGRGGGGAGSPKKHMSSLRDMISSAKPEEREAKMKKELTYQEELKRQIDEKVRSHYIILLDYCCLSFSCL